MLDREFTALKSRVVQALEDGNLFREEPVMTAEDGRSLAQADPDRTTDPRELRLLDRFRERIACGAVRQAPG